MKPKSSQVLTSSEQMIAQLGGLQVPQVPGDHSDPLLMGAAAYANLLQTGLTTTEAARRLGVSAACVRRRIHDRTLLALQDGPIWKLPSFQFTERGELHGWREVAQKLPRDISLVVVEQWLHKPHPDLVIGEGETRVSPRAWLEEALPTEAVTGLADELC